MEEHFNQLTGAMQNLIVTMNKNDVDSAIVHIDKFNGDQHKFSSWIKQIERYCRRKNCDDEAKINIATLTSEGPAADFIDRWVENTQLPAQTFDILKDKLIKHFADVSTPDQARIMLRRLKQKPNENVSAFGGRVYNVAKDAFTEYDPNQRETRKLIENEMIISFVDGLSNDSIKLRIMRSQPDTFEAALDLALNEQSLQRRFDARNPSNSERRWDIKDKDRRQIEPMEISHLRRRTCPLCFKPHSGPCRANMTVQNNKRCFNCGSDRHLARECTKISRNASEQNYRERKPLN